MNYYYINTDTDALGYSPHTKWIQHDRAFTSGDYKQYGVQVLGKLEPGDMLFMYVNGCGVVAAGWVCETWDRRAYESGDRLIYQDTAYTEYRIGVDWCLNTIHKPMRLEDLRKIIGWIPVRTLQRITDTAKAEQLFEEIRNRG